VLRGSSFGPNFDADSVAGALDPSLRRRIAPPAPGRRQPMATAPKDHHRQLDVVSDLATRIGGGEPGIAGVMLESFLVPGRQELNLGRTSGLTYGQSVTDACIGWDDTEVALGRLAAGVSKRRMLPDLERSTA